MVLTCLVLHCKISHNSRPNTPIFLLPKDERREKWLRNMKAENIELKTKRPAICALHFEDRYLTGEKRRVALTKDAVPTILDPDARKETEVSFRFFTFSTFRRFDCRMVACALLSRKVRDTFPAKKAFVERAASC